MCFASIPILLVTNYSFWQAQSSANEDLPTELVLKSGLDNIILPPSKNDRLRKLTPGSKFSLAYAVQASVNSNFLRGGISSNLGVLDVAWLPAAMELPAEVLMDSLSDFGTFTAHGPLALKKPAMISFRGPPFYIESSPFEAKVTGVPSSLSVATPFHVSYSVVNKTNQHQLLTIQVNTPALDNGAAADLLICGTSTGTMKMGPAEKRTLTYTFLATKPGPVSLPSLEVAASRYKSWVIHDNSHEVFVFP